jgi:hypothetical protein
MTTTEAANVLGAYSAYQLDSINKTWKTVLHKEVPISDIYSQYHSIISLQTSSNYNEARAKLKEMLEALTPIERLINDLSIIKEENG